MEVFDLKEMKGKKKIFGREEFKVRHIQLSEGEEIPPCDMTSCVIFTVLEGEVDIRVDSDEVSLEEGDCLISEPGTYSMKTEKGAKIQGIQIPETVG